MHRFEGLKQSDSNLLGAGLCLYPLKSSENLTLLRVKCLAQKLVLCISAAVLRALRSSTVGLDLDPVKDNVI